MAALAWSLSCACIAQLSAGSELMGYPGSAQLEVLRNEARSYEHGEGVGKDPLRAVSLYCDGARYGDAEAQFSLGWMYANGRGVERSDAMAAYFFTLAAGQGDAQAQRMLGFVGSQTAPAPECMNTAVAEIAAEDPEPLANPKQRKIFELVGRLAPEYGVSTRLVIAVIRAESNFEATAVSPRNAQGLMQLIPDTALRFNVRKPFDPEQNIRGGMAYLRWLLAYFEGDVALVSAAYNAGEGAVNRFRGIPPYAETRGYVKRILQLFNEVTHPFDPRISAPSPELSRIRMARSK